MTHHPIIDIQGLDWTYHRTEQSIFDNLHLKIEPNDFFFVVGSSGVGKTTLVKFLIRQLQPPTRMIFHNKEDIARFSATEVQAYRRNVGVIFQDFKLIDRKSVAKNISYPLEIRGVDDDEIRQRVQ
jgi:cell division transport system ATP-binding protein